MNYQLWCHNFKVAVRVMFPFLILASINCACRLAHRSHRLVSKRSSISDGTILSYFVRDLRFFLASLQPTEDSTLEEVVCACDHLSSFTSELFVAPNRLELSQDILTFTAFFTNPISTCIVVVVWSLYIFVVLWARRQDEKDMLKVKLRILSLHTAHSTSFVKAN